MIYIEGKFNLLGLILSISVANTNISDSKNQESNHLKYSKN